MTLTHITSPRFLTFAAILLSATSQLPAEGADTLASSFLNPPDSARPHSFWYWINGNISREGITADLEGMKRAGIGGVELYNVGGHGVAGPVKVLSPQWREMMAHAITTAGKLGLEVDLNNSPGGWSSSGGPWITPELSMQKLTWSETRIQGGKPFSATLAQPAAFQGWYRDVAVIAFPTPAAERDELPKPASTSSDPSFNTALLTDGDESKFGVLAKSEADQPQSIQFTYDQPFLSRSLRIYPRRFGSVPKGRLLASDNGQTWREVLAFAPSRNWASLDTVFAPTKARHWRIEFLQNTPVDLAEIVLGPRYRTAEWTGKAIWDQYGLDKPRFTPPELAAPQECSIPLDTIRDLSGAMDVTGKLTWEAPPGEWTVMRFGHTSTGQTTGPTAPDEKWLECDKFNTAALDVHWTQGMKTLLDDPEIGKHIQYVHIDSYEVGAQNWTQDFPAQFTKSRGYDLLKYLPALTGRVVQDTETSERFLWDFRQVCCGLLANNYFGHMRELCQSAGKQLTIEPYHQTQFKSVTAGGFADVPMCEFWTGGLPGPYWYKLGASPGHVYGRRIIGAEAFTAPREAGGNYNTDPWAFKVLGDTAFCGGVNRYVFHVSVHQPWLDRAPGMTLAAFGTHFERTNTWFEQMPAYTRYVSRCQYLLSQGRFAADVLYFDGENAPDDGYSPMGVIAPPAGYDYDVCDERALRERISVKDKRLVLPDGITYQILVLPDTDRMTPELVRRIGKLVQAGATVVGPRPISSPSLVGQPAADQELKSMVNVLWGTNAAAKVIDHPCGKGRVIWGRPLKDILTGLSVAPDFEARNATAPINYIHRTLDEGELYFISSTGDHAQNAECVFRAAGRQVELWGALTGEVRSLPDSRKESGRTVVPLEFLPRQSFFLLFRNATTPTTRATTNFPQAKTVGEVSGPWDVAFDPKWGGPAKVRFDKLTDWTTHADAGVKYYSGKATYHTTFDAPASGDSKSPMFLDLGTVKNLAEVRLNGVALGTVWCAPWRVPLGNHLKPRGNSLEIDVVNLWPNRMIGDEQLPDDCEWQESGHGGKELKNFPAWLTNNQPRTSGRFTFSSWKHYTKDDPLLPSGLLGPVTLQKER
ncbi:MAG: glycosyl hydrolase [Luteolibacter sp.]